MIMALSGPSRDAFVHQPRALSLVPTMHQVQQMLAFLVPLLLYPCLPHPHPPRP